MGKNPPPRLRMVKISEKPIILPLPVVIDIHGQPPKIAFRTEPMNTDKEDAMKRLAIILAAGLLAASQALAAGSPSYTPAVSKDVKYYNQGVELMLAKQFSEAEIRFRKALDHNNDFAEAHNNLAYTLRKQGPDHYAEALRHYNRAIALNPQLAEPYMYRGVLFVQMGDRSNALKDHETLEAMNPRLADELAYVVENGREKSPERFFGVSREK
jgi:tetratricopeptide (TPR) repeat protein